VPTYRKHGRQWVTVDSPDLKTNEQVKVMSDILDNKLTIVVESEVGGVLFQRVTVEEYSEDTQVHVLKNFGITDGIVGSMKKLAQSAGLKTE